MKKELLHLNKIIEQQNDALYFSPAAIGGIGAGTYTSNMCNTIQNNEVFDFKKEMNKEPEIKKVWIQYREKEIRKNRVKNLILKGFNGDPFYLCLFCKKECKQLEENNCGSFEYKEGSLRYLTGKKRIKTERYKGVK